jgi:hypothetical protein
MLPSRCFAPTWPALQSPGEPNAAICGAKLAETLQIEEGQL